MGNRQNEEILSSGIKGMRAGANATALARQIEAKRRAEALAKVVEQMEKAKSDLLSEVAKERAHLAAVQGDWRHTLEEIDLTAFDAVPRLEALRDKMDAHSRSYVYSDIDDLPDPTAALFKPPAEPPKPARASRERTINAFTLERERKEREQREREESRRSTRRGNRKDLEFLRGRLDSLIDSVQVVARSRLD